MTIFDDEPRSDEPRWLQTQHVFVAALRANLNDIPT